jgi:hypothetical protein
MGVTYYTYRWYDTANGRWPSRDPIEESGGINLYVMVWNNAIVWIDYLGWIEVEGELPDPSQIKPDWTSKLPFNKGGESTYEAYIPFRCEGAKIKAKLDIRELKIELNWNWDAEGSRLKGRTDWRGVYGHEQLHIVSVNKALKKIIQEIEDLDDEGDSKRVENLNEEYGKKVREAIREALEHDSEPGDPNSNKPREGHPYPPQDKSKPVPPRPDQDPTPSQPPPLRPLPPNMR